MKAILMKGGSVADGQRGTVSRADVLVRDGRIAAVGEGLPAAGAETLDCTGLVVTAGFVMRTYTSSRAWYSPPPSEKRYCRTVPHA